MSKTTLISESYLYSLVLSSKLPLAREFKHWGETSELGDAPTSSCTRWCPN